MISLRYVDELGRDVVYTVEDWDAVYCVAEGLVNAPIELQYLEYTEGNRVGVFNLETFTTI